MISGEIWISTFFVNHYLSQYLMLRYFCAIVECEFEWMRVINNSISKYFIQWYLLIPMKQYLMFITWTKSINLTLNVTKNKILYLTLKTPGRFTSYVIIRMSWLNTALHCMIELIFDWVVQDEKFKCYILFSICHDICIYGKLGKWACIGWKQH